MSLLLPVSTFVSNQKTIVMPGFSIFCFCCSQVWKPTWSLEESWNVMCSVAVLSRDCQMEISWRSACLPVLSPALRTSSLEEHRLPRCCCPTNPQTESGLVRRFSTRDGCFCFLFSVVCKKTNKNTNDMTWDNIWPFNNLKSWFYLFYSAFMWGLSHWGPF